MGKGPSGFAARSWGRRPLVNTGAPLPGLAEAERRVLHFQRKLHEWASQDAERRFDDLWNLVCDPATLLVAWSRVSREQGLTDSRSGRLDATVTSSNGSACSGSLRSCERRIPKRDGRYRRLGIPRAPRPCRPDGPQARL